MEPSRCPIVSLSRVCHQPAQIARDTNNLVSACRRRVLYSGGTLRLKLEITSVYRRGTLKPGKPLLVVLFVAFFSPRADFVKPAPRDDGIRSEETHFIIFFNIKQLDDGQRRRRQQPRLKWLLLPQLRFTITHTLRCSLNNNNTSWAPTCTTAGLRWIQSDKEIRREVYGLPTPPTDCTDRRTTTIDYCFYLRAFPLQVCNKFPLATSFHFHDFSRPITAEQPVEHQ